jgi:hypothetical protein
MWYVNGVRTVRGLVPTANSNPPHRSRDEVRTGCRAMRSAGIDLEAGIETGLPRIVATRPATHGLEGHPARIEQAVTEQEPDDGTSEAGRVR